MERRRCGSFHAEHEACNECDSDVKVGAFYMCGCSTQYWTRPDNVQASKSLIEDALCTTHAFRTPATGDETQLRAALKRGR